MYFLRVLTIALFVPGAVCAVLWSGVASGEEPEDKYWPQFEELKKNTLSPERRSEILNKLNDQFWDDGRILYVVGKEAKKYPRARESVLRRLTEIVARTRDEDGGRLGHDGRLCDLFDTLLVEGLLSGDDLSHSAATEVEAVLREAKTNAKAFMFAAPKAAALLLSIDPKHRAAQQALSDWLSSKDRDERTRAAAALALAGKRAEPMADRLRPLLKDEFAEVQMMAAISLWRVERRSADVVGVLRKSLHERPALILRPLTGLRGIDDRYRAIECLAEIGEKVREAASDLAALLKDENQLVRWTAAQALGTIGAPTPEVLSALEAAKTDSNVAVAKSAERSLALLRGQKPSLDPKP